MLEFLFITTLKLLKNHANVKIVPSFSRNVIMIVLTLLNL